jgi:hypothetical protein
MKTLIILLLALLSLSAISQDKIIKTSGDSIKCKVTEIDATQVKYHYANNPSLSFGLDKALVEKIIFETGEVVKMEGNSFKNAEYYAKQNKHALKINFLSPLMGSTEFIYEQSIRPGRSWEAAIGIIGLGADPQDYNPGGVFGKFAYKFIRDPDFYMQTMHYSHLLKGGYFAPEIGIRYMGYDAYNYNYGTGQESNIRKERFDVALMMKLGKQWVFDDAFLVDVYAGIGYGIGGNVDDALNYGFIVGSGDFPVAFTTGIRLGWVFKK